MSNKKRPYRPVQPLNRPTGQIPSPIPQQMPLPGQQMQISPEAIKSAEDIRCINQIPLIIGGKVVEKKTTRCNGHIFVDAYSLKYISPILSPVGGETIGNLLIGKMCTNCGKVFNPDKWMKTKKEIKTNEQAP